jgi:tetratricopeptide (TPR) repeat protein
LQKAEERLLELIKIDRNNLNARTELAKVYQELYRATKDRNYLQKAEERLLESLKIDKYNFFAHAEFVKVCNFALKPRKALKTIDTFLSQKGLRMGNHNSRTHQALFNNLFSLCGQYKYYDKAKEYFESYSGVLDERNIENYRYRLKDKTFNFEQRDVEGKIGKIGYDFIIINNHKYTKKSGVFVESGDRVLFDIDKDGNATNIEKLDEISSMENQ